MISATILAAVCGREPYVERPARIWLSETDINVSQGCVQQVWGVVGSLLQSYCYVSRWNNCENLTLRSKVTEKNTEVSVFWTTLYICCHWHRQWGS